MQTFFGLNPRIMYAYQDAYIEQKKQEMKMLDAAAFYNGLYVQRAIASCFNKSARYPEKPLSLLEQQEPLSAAEKFKLWVEEFNRNFDEDRE